MKLGVFGDAKQVGDKIDFARALEAGLSAGGVTGLPGRQPGPGRVNGLLGDPLGLRRVLLEMLANRVQSSRSDWHRIAAQSRKPYHRDLACL